MKKEWVVMTLITTEDNVNKREELIDMLSTRHSSCHGLLKGVAWLKRYVRWLIRKCECRDFNNSQVTVKEISKDDCADISNYSRRTSLLK